MFAYIGDMGPIGLFNIVILLAITIMAVRNAYVLLIDKNPVRIAKLGRSINAMLFWGVIVLLLGFIGTVLGINSVLGIFASMPQGMDMDPRVVMGGFYESLILLNFSLAAFIVVALAWFLLSWRHHKLLTDDLRREYGRE